MSNLKFARDLFLDLEELNRFKKFLAVDGTQFNLKNNSEQFGIIRNKFFDTNFNYFKVNAVDSVNTIFVNAGFAYDLSGDVLACNGRQLVVPQSNVWYWLKIAYGISNVEPGTITIGGQQANLMKGTGTKFTEVLRGAPNFPSKIKFNNSVNYTAEFEILEVVDDVTAYVTGVFPVNEGSLTYSVAGTFTPGVYPITNNTQDDEFPFQYDDFIATFVPETALDLMPALNNGSEFFICRVRADSAIGLLLEDKRRSFIHKTKAETYFSELPNAANPLIAIESVNLVNIRGSQYYLANICHGFRIVTEQRDLSANKIIINSGYGGAYKSTSAFVTGDFDNWRYYYVDGSYSRIISSTSVGGTIVLILETINKYSVGSLICPNAEEIELVFTFNDENNVTYRVERFRSYSFTDTVQITLRDDEVNVTNRRVIVSYRYKTVFSLSVLRSLNINTYPLQNVGNVTDLNVVLNQSSIVNPTSQTFWKGINQFCNLQNLGSSPVYYKVTLQNPVGPTTVYTPNGTAPTTSEDTTTTDLLIQFYSDSGLTTPVVVTQSGLILFLKLTNTITATNYDSSGNPTSYSYVQESVQYFQVNAAGNNVVIPSIDKLVTDYDHPTMLPGTRRVTFNVATAFAVFPSKQIFMPNNGIKGFNDLAQYYITTQLPTGVTKPNLNTDPDYIAPTSDTINCAIAVGQLSLSYGYALDVKIMNLTGDSTGLVTGTLVADTTSGGYSYVLPAFVTDENVRMDVKIKTLDSGNISGSVWVRITWRAMGTNSDTVSQIQVPSDTETNISSVFQNIRNVNISNY